MDDILYISAFEAVRIFTTHSIIDGDYDPELHDIEEIEEARKLIADAVCFEPKALAKIIRTHVDLFDPNSEYKRAEVLRYGHTIAKVYLRDTQPKTATEDADVIPF